MAWDKLIYMNTADSGGGHDVQSLQGVHITYDKAGKKKLVYISVTCLDEDKIYELSKACVGWYTATRKWQKQQISTVSQ